MSLLGLILFLGTVVGSNGMDVKLEYYETVSFKCNESNYNFTKTETVVKQYWLIPNGDLKTEASEDGHFEIDGNFTLTVDRISDDDFGHYFCLLIRSDHTVDRIVHGLNVNGPYFGDLLKKYRENAIIGGIAAGSLFVAVSLFCIVSQLRYQKRRHRDKAVDELDKAIDGYDLKAYTNVGLETENEEMGTVVDQKEIETTVTPLPEDNL